MKKYKDVIIVDEDNRPMSWSESNEQLVMCTNDTWEDEHTPVETYTVKKAQRLIAKTIANRKNWNMSPGIYRTMPFNYQIRKKFFFPHSRTQPMTPVFKYNKEKKALIEQPSGAIGNAGAWNPLRQIDTPYEDWGEGELMEGRDFDVKGKFYSGNYNNICAVCQTEFTNADKLWLLCPYHSVQAAPTSTPEGEKEGELWDRITNFPILHDSAMKYAKGITSAYNGFEAGVKWLIEYLKESFAPSTAKEDAVAIIKWMEDFTTVVHKGERKWCTHDVAEFGSANELDYMTHGQLYQLFKQHSNGQR